MKQIQNCKPSVFLNSVGNGSHNFSMRNMITVKPAMFVYDLLMIATRPNELLSLDFLHSIRCN